MVADDAEPRGLYEGTSISVDPSPWTPQTDAYEVHGLIRQKWAALGCEIFGYPTSDETGTPDGVGRLNMVSVTIR